MDIAHAVILPNPLCKPYLCSLMSYSIDQILANLQIEALNEMQQASIEANKKHDDVILLSATGSGKTLAYLLPVLESLDYSNTSTTQAIIVVPSRELALQIEQVFRGMATGLKITAWIRSRIALAVIGLTTNSVTPASRASWTRFRSEWPVIMMIGR